MRPFVGCSDYAASRAFYAELGFTEVDLGTMCYLESPGRVGFYLQDAYVKEWVDNTMLFLEVDDLEAWHTHVERLDLPSRYLRVRLSKIVEEDWGREFFLHDPSGVLWHIGNFVA